MTGERGERVVFFGTPQFAVPTLAALCRTGRDPLRVISQPARPVGRGRRLEEPPVSRWARERGLEVEQPARVDDGDFLDRLAALAPSVAVVVAFGQIFPPRLLELPRRGCVNLHASLLPRYRGAAPVQAAILAGDRTTGVTTMLMERELDTGPLLLQEKVAIGDEETAGEVSERLATTGAELVIRTLSLLEGDRLVPRPQRDEDATFAPRLRKSDGRIDWRRDARSLFNLLRGLTPWPGVFCELRGIPLKILWGRPVDSLEADAAAGAFLGLIQNRLVVRCGQQTAFGIERLQRPGRKELSATEFLNGERLEIGERFR